MGMANITAQNINDIMEELAKSEKAMHQIVDKAMLETQFSGDSAKIKNMPSFINKIDNMDVVIIEEASDSDKVLIEKLSNFKDGNGYMSLVKVKDDDSDVHIVSYKNNDNISDIYIIVIDGNTLVLVKMTGELSENDIQEIINEQTKDISKAKN